MPKYKPKEIEVVKESFENGIMKLKREWEIVYDSGAALEPFYYWIVDFMTKMGLKVTKIVDTYSFSYRSDKWGKKQQKRHHTLQDANSLMAQIGQIIKGLIAIKKDHQRIKEALEFYGKGEKTPDDLVLKGIWMDNIDPKSGPAAMVNAAKNASFFGIRDFFFKVNSEKEIAELPSGDRIKNYLRRKLKEYNVWKKHWRKSLEEMEKTIEERMKSSAASIDLYKKWVAPLIRDVEALSDKHDPFDPNLLKMGSSVYGEVKLVGHSTSSEYPGYVAVVHVDMKMRGMSPNAITKTEVKVQPMVYTEDAFEKKQEEWKEDPVDKWVKNLMLEYKYVEDDSTKKKDTKPKTFVEEILASIQENYGKKEKDGKKKKKGKKFQLFSNEANLVNEAKKIALNKGWLIYDIAKNAFLMLGWPTDRIYDETGKTFQRQ